MEHQYPDLDRFVYWLTAQWDNQAQVEHQLAQKLPTDDRHARQPMRWVRVKTRDIDGVVLALHSYGEHGFGAPAERVTLHRFSFSPVHKHVVHELLEVKDRDRFGPVDGELDKLKKLGWADVRTNPTCNLYWKWNLNHFKGQTLPGMCVTDSPSERPILIEASGELWNDRMVRNDRNYRLDGSLIGRRGGDTPILFERLD